MGGGAMRTAAKAAALGGYRSAVPAAVTAGRMAPRPPSAAVAAAPAVAEGPGPAISLLSSEKGPVIAAVQRPSWELDEWEFAGGEEEELLGSLDPAPRLVFGPVPTLEEAKEATTDLKDALERVYFTATSNEVSTKDGRDCPSPENMPIVPSVPKHVTQAFSLLQGSPEAQDVVASLASDKNVWEAVMKNEKVMDFYRTYQSTVMPPETNIDSEDSASEYDCAAESMDSSKTSAMENSKSSMFGDLMHNIKVKVTEMVSNISNFFQDLLGISTDGHSSTNAKDVTIGASFLALAIAAILVVLVKRG